MTVTVRDVPIEPLTEAAFAPFGELISVKARPPDFETVSGTSGWAVDFRAGRPLVMVLRTPYQGLTFSKMERHFGVTQTFLPLGGSLAVVAVAPPTDRESIPDPGAVRAFLLDGTQGYLLRFDCNAGRPARWGRWPRTDQWSRSSRRRRTRRS